MLPKDPRCLFSLSFAGGFVLVFLSCMGPPSVGLVAFVGFVLVFLSGSKPTSGPFCGVVVFVILLLFL